MGETLMTLHTNANRGMTWLHIFNTLSHIYNTSRAELNMSREFI